MRCFPFSMVVNMTIPKNARKAGAFEPYGHFTVKRPRSRYLLFAFVFFGKFERLLVGFVEIVDNKLIQFAVGVCELV